MNTVESFLTPAEEQSVVKAIRTAEKNTSGEIRVHLENYEGSDTMTRAREVFHLLKMDNTKQENGVILYVAVNLKKFVVYGDVGINKVVPKDFWNHTRDVIQQEFQQGNFAAGLEKGVFQIGNELKAHFPWGDFDTNELTDDISKF